MSTYIRTDTQDWQVTALVPGEIKLNFLPPVTVFRWLNKIFFGLKDVAEVENRVKSKGETGRTLKPREGD